MQITKDNRNFYEIPTRLTANSGENYEIQEYIGAGGNAAVYECIDSEGNEYAIKFLLNLSNQSRMRFKQEIRTLRNVSHPHLIQCLDEGKVKGQTVNRGKKEEWIIPYMIMEKADINLRDYLLTRDRVDYSDYIFQFLGLSEALALLNEKVVHRDIKLENILVVGEKWVLSDLGLCSYISSEEHEELTGINENIGPKYWMSPEAINRRYNKNVNIITASDVFQLSAVFWFVATGFYPLGIVEEGDWKNDDIKTCKLLLRALSFDPKKRPQNGAQLYNEFQKVRNYYENR